MRAKPGSRASSTKQALDAAIHLLRRNRFDTPGTDFDGREISNFASLCPRVLALKKLPKAMSENEISKIIVDSAIEVHRELGGPGLIVGERHLTQRREDAEAQSQETNWLLDHRSPFGDLD
jgi:hypothetical protein